MPAFLLPVGVVHQYVTRFLRIPFTKIMNERVCTMIATARVYQAIIAGMMFLTCMGTASPPAAPGAIDWGATSGGLQCGLTMLPQNGGAYVVRVTLKNVGSNNITFLIGDLQHALSVGLIAADQAGKTSRQWFSLSGADPTRPIAVAPGEAIPMQFIALKTDVAGRSLTFDGSLTPHGASSSIPLHCGPLILNSPKT